MSDHRVFTFEDSLKAQVSKHAPDLSQVIRDVRRSSRGLILKCDCKIGTRLKDGKSMKPLHVSASCDRIIFFVFNHFKLPN